MIVKLTEETINEICNGLLDGTMDRVTIEPRSKTRKGITFFVHFEKHAPGVKDHVTQKHIEAAKSLMEFWDMNEANRVVDFSFRKSNETSLIFHTAYSQETGRKNILANLEGILNCINAEPELGDYTLNKVKVTAIVEGLINAYSNKK
jgi:hypothetical protein